MIVYVLCVYGHLSGIWTHPAPQSSSFRRKKLRQHLPGQVAQLNDSHRLSVLPLCRYIADIYSTQSRPSCYTDNPGPVDLLRCPSADTRSVVCHAVCGPIEVAGSLPAPGPSSPPGSERPPASPAACADGAPQCSNALEARSRALQALEEKQLGGELGGSVSWNWRSLPRVWLIWSPKRFGGTSASPSALHTFLALPGGVAPCHPPRRRHPSVKVFKTKAAALCCEPKWNITGVQTKHLLGKFASKRTVHALLTLGTKKRSTP